MKLIGKYALLVALLSILNIACDKEEPQKEAPVANFSYYNGLGTDYIPTYKDIAFENESTGEISTYSWNFDSGHAYSNEENPVFAFNSMGTKQVTLTVEGPGGRSSLTKEFEVNTGKITLGSVTFYTTDTKGYYCVIDDITSFDEAEIKQPSLGGVTWSFTQNECQFSVKSEEWLSKGNSTFNSVIINIYDSNHNIQTSGVLLARNITLDRPHILNLASGKLSVTLYYE